MASIFQPFRHQLYKSIEKHAPELQGRVLDIGCGTSPRYKKLFAHCDYSGTDPKIDGSTVEKLSYADASFDGFLCTQVLEEVKHVETALQEMCRILKPGGTGIISIGFTDAIKINTPDYWRFTEMGISEKVRNAGFTVKKVEPVGGYWAARAQMTIRYFINRFDLYDSRLWRVWNFLAKGYSWWMLKLDAWDFQDFYTNGYIVVVQK